MNHKRSVFFRVLSVAMAALLLLPIGSALGVLPALKANADTWGGSYTTNSGYSISGTTISITSANGFAYIADRMVNGNYLTYTLNLETDLDMNNITFKGMTPYDNPFKGTFNGKNHTISNFKMDMSDNRVGMFRKVDGCTVKDITFSNVSINGTKTGTGVVVGLADGAACTFTNVKVLSGTVTGNARTGGIVGELNGSGHHTFSLCQNGAKISQSGSDIGGIVGSRQTNDYVTYTNCSNTGEVYGNYAGGIMGWNKGFGNFTDCSNAGYIHTRSEGEAGGISGKVEDDKQIYTRCRNTGTITAHGHAGGILGYVNSGSTPSEFYNCENTGAITSTSNSAGGMMGRYGADLDKNTFHDCVNRGAIKASSRAGGMLGDNKGHAEYLRCVNYGNISASGSDAGGICGYVEDDEQWLTDCVNYGAVTSNSACGGGMIGYCGDSAAGTFTRCFNFGDVTAGSHGGGIIGGEDWGSPAGVVSYCMNWGDVNANNNGGGIVGNGNWLDVQLCFNKGNIKKRDNNTGYSVGGMVGDDSNRVENCFNTGTVRYGDYAAGMVGYKAYGTGIVNCYNAGSITNANNNYQIYGNSSTADTNNYYLNSVSGTGRSGETTVSAADLQASNMPGRLNSSAYVQDTWGVNSKYPIHKWWRDGYFYFTAIFKDGDTTVSSVRKLYNNTITAPTMSKTGYTFNGWYSGSTKVAGSGGSLTAGITAPMNTTSLTRASNTATWEGSVTYTASWTKNKYYLDVNGWLDDNSGAGGVGGYGTFDVYVNGSLVADDVDDFYQQIYYEDTYEIRDIKAASGKAYVGATEGALSGTMGTDTINVRLRFKTQYTVNFKDANGNTVDTQTVLYGENATAPQMTEYIQKTGDAAVHYHFLGTWDTDFTNVTSNLTVRGNYETQQHSYGAYESLSAANHIRSCPVCGYVENTMHDFTAQTVNANALKTAATCTDAAVYYYSCSECGLVENNAAHTFTSGAANGHQYGEWVPAQAATCSAAGHVGYYFCSVCEKYFDAEYNEIADIVLSIDPDAHNYGDWTRLNDEKHQRVCANDENHIQTAEHNWQQTGSTAATCTAQATTSYKCSDCEATRTETGAYGDHAYGEWIAEVPAKCEAAGVKGHYHCAVCGKDFDAEKNILTDLVIPQLNHAWGEWTKLNDNEHQRVCANDENHIQTAEHNWQQTGSTAATCTAQATTSYKCAECEATKTETGAYGDHAYGEWIVEVPAKCEAVGVKGHYHCAVCDKDFDAEKNILTDLAIPQLNHAWGAWTKVDDNEHQRVCANDENHIQTAEHNWQQTGSTAATCTAQATTSYKCAECEATKTETGAYGDHAYGTWIAEVPAKCEAAGVKGHYHCAVCDKDFDAEKNELTDLAIPQLNHDWGEWIKVDDNEHRRVCANDENHVETAEHSWQQTGSTAATCTAQATTSYKCSDCEATKTETGAYGDHAYGEWIAEVPAKCEEAGVKGHYHCAVCGKDFDAEKNVLTDLAIPQLNHDWGAWAKLNDNEHQRVCANDENHVETAEHSWQQTGSTAATCTEQATTSYKCSDCEATRTETGAYSDHAYGEWIAEVPAKCEEAGVLGHYHCDVCGKDFDAEKNVLTDLVIPQLNHDWGEWTKLNDNEHQRVCANDENHVETAEHSWQQTGSTAATCTAQATTSYKCSVCDATKTETGAYGDHAYGEWIAEVPAKCEEAGVKGHYHCDVCGKDFDAEKNVLTDLAIPQLNHAWGDWTKLNDNEHQRVCANDPSHVEAADHNWQQTGSTTATCVAAGTVSYKCSVCDATKTETGAYGDHALTFVPAVDGSDCKHTGTAAYYLCGLCGRAYADENAAAELASTDSGVYGPHTPGEAVSENVTEASCTAPGSYEEAVYCAVCGETLRRETKEIPAKGHDFGEWTETSAPSCTEAGEETRTCSRRDAYETRPVNALGHDYTSWAAVTPATCTEAGEETRGCSRCDITENRTVPALGHTWGEWVTVREATVNEEGLERHVCLVCNETEERVIPFAGEKNRTVQFVVTGSMHYVVHLQGVDYEIYSKHTPAIYWYDGADLTFEVVLHPDCGYSDYTVSLNDKVLKQNPDGSYTIPGGTEYVKININPVSTAASDGGSHTSSGGVCKYCGKVHPNNLWGMIVAFFHAIFYFFKHLFG